MAGASNRGPRDEQCVHHLPAQHTLHKDSAHRYPVYLLSSQIVLTTQLEAKLDTSGIATHTNYPRDPFCTHPYHRRVQTGTDCEYQAQPDFTSQRHNVGPPTVPQLILIRSPHDRKGLQRHCCKRSFVLRSQRSKPAAKGHSEHTFRSPRFPYFTK